MHPMTRTLAALAAVCLLAAACSAGAGSPASAATNTPVVTATPTPVPTPVHLTAPPATPKAMTPGTGDQHVEGSITNAVLSTPYTTTTVNRGDGITQEIRGGVATLTFDMNDVRVDGKATFTFGLNVYTQAAAEWATFRLATDKGAWEGPCTGGGWHDGNGLIQSCWLAGSGGYKSYTYYLTFTGPENGDANANGIAQGIIYPGAPPKA